jgi:ribonuclease HI
VGWVAVIRDNNGVLKLSVAEGIDGITSPELAEAMAIRGALSIAFNNGFKDIILASDCLSSASTLQLWIVLLSALW